MKKKRASGKMVVGVSLGFFVVALAFLVVGLSHTIKEITEAVIVRDPAVILASEGVPDGRPVQTPVSYRDLDSDNMPLAEEKFAEKNLDNLIGWFSAMSKTNSNSTSSIRLNYKADGAEFSFCEDQFYPLDEAALTDEAALMGGTTEDNAVENNVAKNVANSANDGTVSSEGAVGEHNRLFAMAYGVPITVLASGDEFFEVNTDDATLVFVNDNLVIDLDGEGEPLTGALQIYENGEIYVSADGGAMTYSGVSVKQDDSAIIRVFHLDEGLGESIFELRFAGMSPTLLVSSMTYNDDDDVRIAYDPSGLSTTLSSGISKVFKASNAKNLIIMATLEGAALMVFMFVTLSIIRGHKKKH